MSSRTKVGLRGYLSDILLVLIFLTILLFSGSSSVVTIVGSLWQMSRTYSSSIIPLMAIHRFSKSYFTLLNLQTFDLSIFPLTFSILSSNSLIKSEVLFVIVLTIMHSCILAQLLLNLCILALLLSIMILSSYALSSNILFTLTIVSSIFW